MGYFLQAIVGRQQTLVQHALEFHHARVVPLACGIAIIPLTNDLYDEIADGGKVDRFSKLSPGVERWAQRISASAPVAYIEADYFGGLGGQSALVWSSGTRVLGPVHGRTPSTRRCAFLEFNPAEHTMSSMQWASGGHRNTADWIQEEKE